MTLYRVYRNVRRDPSDPPGGPTKTVELAQIKDESAAHALMLYAGRNGLVGHPQGRSAFAVPGYGLLHAERVDGCECDQRRGFYWDASGVCRCRSCRLPVNGSGPAEPAFQLSDRQRAVLAFLEDANRGTAKAIRAATGAGENTLVSLVGLNLVERHPAGRAYTYHLTDLARLALDRAEAAPDPPSEGAASGLPRKAARPATRSRRKGVKNMTDATAEVPAVEDVTGKPNGSDTADTKGLEKELMKRLRAAVSGSVKVTAKAAYRRLDHKDTRLGSVRTQKKGLLVRVPKEGGYDNIHVTADSEIDAAVTALAARIED